MKKAISLLLCLLLTLGMAASFSACSKPVTIVGTWTTTMDYADEITELLLDGADGFDTFFSVPSFPLKLNVEIYEDSTCMFYVDELELNNSLAALDEPLRSGIRQYFNAMGLDTQTLESMGASVDTAMQFFHDKELVPTICQSYYVSGTYRLEENTIYLNDHPTNLPDGSSYATVELSRTELTFKDGKLTFETVPQLAEALNAGLTFKRVEKED